MYQSCSPVWSPVIFRHRVAQWHRRNIKHVLHLPGFALLSPGSCAHLTWFLSFPSKVFKTVSQSWYQAQSGCQRSSATGVAQAPPLTDTQPTSHVPPNNLFAAKAANLCQNVRNIQQIVRNIHQIVHMPQCKRMCEHLCRLAVAPIILLASCLSTKKVFLSSGIGYLGRQRY